MKNTVKRITNIDIKNYYKLELEKNGIYIQFDETDLMKARALIIGPSDTIYENAYLFFNIEFPKNYPFSPPTVRYIAQNNVRIHPNIYTNGKVCLSILGTWNGPSWSSIMDINTVLLTIQSLLDNNPLVHEPGCNNPKFKKKQLIYKRIINYNTYNSLIIDVVKRDLGDFEIFREIIDKTFDCKKTIENIEKLKNEYTDNEILMCSIYRIKFSINIERLKKKYLK
jgi:ubiquitin-protein ligase